MDFKKFLMFGDSITEFAFNTRISPESGRDEFCVGAALTNAYTRKLQVIQRGFSGYNSRWALKLLPQILATERDIVIAYVFFGTNDAAMDSVQTVPLVEYVRNMTEMVQMLHAANIKVVLVGPALHDAHKWLRDESGSVTPGSRNNANNKLYSDALAGVAREQRTGFVDLHRAFSEAGGERWSDLLVDGIHYSGRGYEVFYKELMAVIDRTFPELSPDNVPFRFPNWRDVAPDGSNL
ncbi:FACR201Cp [Eremothecium gossypii FDAG1]|nr:FACR201Cp [Eremothecium gossypii FDAG1]